MNFNQRDELIDTICTLELLTNKYIEHVLSEQCILDVSLHKHIGRLQKTLRKTSGLQKTLDSLRNIVTEFYPFDDDDDESWGPRPGQFLRTPQEWG